MTSFNFGPADFMTATNVSHETGAALELYAELLVKWQKKINLVGPKTLPDLWHRHFLDSAQLCPLIPKTARMLVDLGSGAGFPGLVLGLMTGLEIHLIESDGRKCAFLREVARLTHISERVIIHTRRAESVPPFPADVITARALASLENLFPLIQPFWGPSTLALLPKGTRYKEELTAANYGWYLNHGCIASQVDRDSVILTITDLQQKQDRCTERKHGEGM